MSDLIVIGYPDETIADDAAAGGGRVAGRVSRRPPHHMLCMR
jgi:hypothetical protein